MQDTHLHHYEEHLQSSDLLKDIVIGMSDGLTVPFALAAGLTTVFIVVLPTVTLVPCPEAATNTFFPESKSKEAPFLTVYNE